MGLIIAAPRSGSGKTLLSLCLTAALRQRGLTMQTFKVGPDYLDAQLLGAFSGRPCRNLDPLLCGEPWLRAAFRHWGRTPDACLVEGVMGLYDGLGPSQEGSTAHVARLLNLPLLFVVDAARQGASIRALVAGFREQASELPWCGVVLNGVGSLRHQQLLTAALEPTGLPVLGCLPRCGAMALPSRHLGLLPPAEIHHFQARCRQLAALAERQLDVSRLLPRLQASRGAPGPSPFLAASPTDAPPRPRPSGAPGPLLAIAQDQAFCFLYPEQREWLEHWGARTQAWSPLADQPLPQGTAALVLPGGYPELHGATLAQATRSLRALQAAHGRGLPIYAECGGMLLLLRTLHDPDNRPWPMAGILPGAACRGAFQLGYRRALACGASPVVRPHEQMVGHEFHHWQVAPAPADTPWHLGAQPASDLHTLWRLSGWGVPTRSEGLAHGRLHASWLHLHWSGQPQVPRRLVAVARRAQEPGVRRRRNNT